MESAFVSVGKPLSTSFSAASYSTVSSAGTLWGPAITASSLTEAMTSASQQMSALPLSRRLSESDQRLVVCSTIVGGCIVIISILVYVLVCMRRYTTTRSIRCLGGRTAGSVSSANPQDGQRTVLSVLRDTQFSVQSSRYLWVTKDPPPVSQIKHQLAPSPLIYHLQLQEKHKKPTLHIDTKAIEPSVQRPDITGSRTPLLRNLSAKKGVKFAVSKIGSKASRKTSKDKSKTVEAPAEVALKAEGSLLPSPEPSAPHVHRWSWTNSQAPATPRIYVPSVRSLGDSFLRLKRASSRVSWQREQVADEEVLVGAAQVPPSMFRTPSTRKLLLKNQGTKPILSPPPVARPASGLARIGTLSSIWKPSQLVNVSSISVIDGQKGANSPTPSMGGAVP